MTTLTEGVEMYLDAEGTDYVYDRELAEEVRALDRRVADMRSAGALTSDVLQRIRKHFRIKNI